MQELRDRLCRPALGGQNIIFRTVRKPRTDEKGVVWFKYISMYTIYSEHPAQTLDFNIWATSDEDAQYRLGQIKLNGSILGKLRAEIIAD